MLRRLGINHGDIMNESNLLYKKARNTKLLMRLDGNLIDECGGIITASFGVTYAANQKFGKQAAKFATNGYAVVAASANTTFSGDFTIEMQFMPTNVTEENPLSSGVGCYLDFVRKSQFNGGRPSCYGAVAPTNSGVNYMLGDTPYTGTMHHLAIARKGSTMRMFWDGNIVSTITNTNPWGGQPICVGNYSTSNGTGCTGGMQELRMSNICRYEAAFTPPSAPFVMD